MSIKAPRGTKDIFGTEAQKWQDVEAMIRQVCKSFGISEMRTPIFEQTELFQRGVGETTDIVQKEMYTFEDKGGRSITLKPEGTAGCARAYIEHKLFTEAQPVKLYYIIPAFRYERPEAGRMRQFHQFGAEFYGSYSAVCDAEVISLVNEILQRLGLKNIELKLNTLGGNQCRKKYNQILKDYIGSNLDKLCPDCRERFEKNPLRVLDCKNEECQKVIGDAPAVIDCLDEECKAHFELLKKSLDNMGIKYTVDPRIVRGLDYYTRTVFEFVSNEIGSQGTVCGGGRYDNLIEECGGPATGAVGFAMGIERIMILLNKQAEQEAMLKRDIDLFIGSIGDEGFMLAQSIGYKLRRLGICAEYDTIGRSVKAQLKLADKIGAKYTIVIGDSEIESDKIMLKEMSTGEQREIKLSEIEKELTREN